MTKKEIKLRCLVVEDDAPSQCLIKHFIQLSESLELMHCVDDARKAKHILSSNQIDLLFLDINLPGLSGIELLETIDSHPPVIFTTAYPNYALDSFNFNVVDYLLKPISEDRFNRAVQRALEKRNSDSIKIQHEFENIPTFINIPIGIDSVEVDINAIIYLQSWGNYVKIFTTEKMILAYITTQALLEMLPSSRFFRVHKSFTINKSYITSKNRNEIIVVSTPIPIGISYRQSVLSSL